MNDDFERQLKELSDRVGQDQHGLPQFDQAARRKIRVRQTLVATAATAVLFGGIAGGFAVVGTFQERTEPAQFVSSNVIAAAAAATEAQASAQMTFEGHLAMTGGTEISAKFTGDGVFDFVDQTGRMTLDGLLGTNMEFIWKDGISYTKVSTPESEEKWIKRETPDSMSMGFDPMSSNAGSMLSSLEAVSSEVQMLGSEDIRDVTTTHYRAEIDPAAALSAMHEAENNPFDSFDVEGIPVEIWVDEEGLVRKLSMFFEMGGERDGESTHFAMDMTMELFDFGVDVDVQAPPAEDVVTEDEFRDQMSASAGESTTVTARRVKEKAHSYKVTYPRSAAHKVRPNNP